MRPISNWDFSHKTTKKNFRFYFFFFSFKTLKSEITRAFELCCCYFDADCQINEQVGAVVIVFYKNPQRPVEHNSVRNSCVCLRLILLHSRTFVFLFVLLLWPAQATLVCCARVFAVLVDCHWILYDLSFDRKHPPQLIQVIYTKTIH